MPTLKYKQLRSVPEGQLGEAAVGKSKWKTDKRKLKHIDHSITYIDFGYVNM